MPTVSVIIPTYNRAGFITRAIESVLAQEFQDFELIVVDDGSSDGTDKVVARYRDSRIMYQWQERGERSRARNAGIALSRGKYIAFLDSDDWYLPNKLSDQVTALEERPAGGLALGGWSIVDESGRKIQEVSPWEDVSPQPTLEEWLSASLATPITVMVSRPWLDRVGWFDENNPAYEDIELFIRLSLAGCSVVWTKRSVAVVLAHGENSSRDYARARKGRMALLAKVFSGPNSQKHLTRRTTQEVYASYHLTLAWEAYEAGLFEQGKQELLEAVELNPKLRDQDGETIRGNMIGHTQSYLASDPQDFLDRAFVHLPDSLACIRPHYGDTLGRSWMSRAWQRHRVGDLNEVRRSIFRAVRYKPACLKDRGIQSMLIQSIVGPRIWSRIRGNRSGQSADSWPGHGKRDRRR